ncbi:response regulator [Paenibacillus frigoriresistens]|uniref:helix-turn-helix domain-containing protein n=1 Tax=Paenibacillus alginolyticus TaxID=59839 RepID=UPI00156330D2|nr:helix-turn-helix domain-containing protein [Paenibacillus frigoriresistens]NRF93869.1 response regulator [Paenibacillus frigoriresistens]
MKIMIVDDEIIIREGLSKVIDWKQLGFTFLSPAESAEEALERMPAERPDLILSDIRMFGKDGLTMAKEAKVLLPNVEIIMLTGYDDFEYMQQAIRNEVSDYLLKTSRPADIIQAVHRAVQRIRNKWETQSQAILKDKEIRKRWLEKMLTEGISEGNHLLNDYFPLLKPEETQLQVLLIRAAGWGDKDSNRPLLQFAVDNMLREMIPCETLHMTSMLAVVLRVEEGWRVEGRYRTLAAKIEHLLKCTLYCAVGTPVNSGNELHISYRNAVQASKFWMMYVQERNWSYEQIKTRRGSRTLCSREEESELSQLLLSGDELRLNQWIGSRISEYLVHPDATYDSLSSYIQSLAISGFRWLERVASESETGQAQISDFTSWGEANGETTLRDSLQHYLHALMNVYRQSLSKGPTGYVERVISFVRANIGSQKLTLVQAARHVHLHPGHLSEVFKKETGSNFIDFLVKQKLELAREMLKDPSVKVSDISRSLGYEDVKYFSQLFRKHFGQTPSEYREQV